MQADLFRFYIFSVLLLLSTGAGFVFFVCFHRRRQTAYKTATRQLQSGHVHELLQTRSEVAEKAMTQISQELHDNLGQLMAGSLQYLHLATHKLVPGQEAEWLSVSKDLMTRAVHDLRNISHSLSSGPLFELGLLRCVQNELAQLEPLGIKNNFAVSGVPAVLRGEQELLIFRIFQEAILNILKHASASGVDISFQFASRQLTVEIADDGKGFDPDRVDTGGHLGLLNIRHRAALLKASVEVVTGLNKGCILRLVIPLCDDQQAD